MEINKRTKGMTYAIREIVVNAREVEKQGHEVLKLNIGDPNKYDFDTPDFLKQSLSDAALNGNNYYGDSEGIPAVCEAIANREKKYKNIDIAPEQYLPTSGASEGMNMVFASLVGLGDDVVMPGPSYPLYISLTNFYGGSPVEYRTIEEEGWQPDIDDIRSKVNENTKAIVVINPNNPTGALYPEKTLKEITDIAAENDVPIICDEIYDLITFDRKFVSTASLADDVNFIVIGGLSKVYFAPGWRIGYMGFKGPDDEINKLKEACYKMARGRLSTNTPAQLALKTAMESDHSYLEGYLSKLKERAKFSFKRLNEIEGISVTEAHGAMYMFPKIELDSYKGRDKKFVLDLLEEKHVLTVHGSGFGEQYGGDHFRIVFLPPMETLENAFDKLEDFCKSKK
ncbi:MAG: aminotransferase class I/II-fold pyridoxal phosphate-dependent enzyme [archaeon]|jgi:aspartate/methionine/tyrosine aminotransferase|nr:alanine aminotransferase [Euryarchaeota archaeon]MDP6704013.1 aminotransferase class I/II-fold pyridoxal phosphate-dependent enzyme [archaeon]|tara:strand:- start:9569 stop:10762 length:1194 start_codon:yes stop_codon:yes gene_type:complete